jgi:GT2 family glycosyltransferase
MTIEDTARCIDSLLLCTDQYCQIIVVDNGSTNGTGLKIQKMYLNKKNVTVLINQNNSGFSKGNNLGCQFAFERFSPELICVFNNDTFIEDKNFVSKLKAIYERTQFDALGPRIISLHTGQNQNPRPSLSSLRDVRISEWKLKVGRTILGMRIPILYYFFCKLSNFVKPTKLGLHGAALVFSKSYIQKFPEIFPEQTFLYGEEDMLFYRKLRHGLNFVYTEDLEIFHDLSKSTNAITGNRINRWRFQNRHMLIANRRLQEIYKQSIDI